jgi:hypothetical protein
MILNEQNIEFILANDVERARAAFDAAKEQFKSVTADDPSGIPHPDGIHRLISEAAFRAAIAAYGLALREFNEFLFAGTIPDRLKEPWRGPKDSSKQPKTA